MTPDECSDATMGGSCDKEDLKNLFVTELLQVIDNLSC